MNKYKYLNIKGTNLEEGQLEKYLKTNRWRTYYK